MGSCIGIALEEGRSAWGVMYFDFWVGNVKKKLQPFHVNKPPLLHLFGFFFLFSFQIRNRPNWGRRAGPWLGPGAALEEGSAVSFVSVFSQPTAKMETTSSQPVFFFLSFRQKAVLPISWKADLPVPVLSPAPPSSKIYWFYEPTGNPTAVSWSIPLLTVGPPCI